MHVQIPRMSSACDGGHQTHLELPARITKRDHVIANRTLFREAWMRREREDVTPLARKHQPQRPALLIRETDSTRESLSVKEHRGLVKAIEGNVQRLVVHRQILGFSD